MNRDNLMDAIGMIDESYVSEAHAAARTRRSPARLVVAAAAVLVLAFATSLTAMAAADVAGAYDLLYGFSPAVAQLVKSVNESCVNNGIRMEVISANISGSDAYAFISIEDLEGDRVDGTIDLFDSYEINRSFDSAGHCARIGYDEKTGKAMLLVHIQSMDGRDIPQGKVTFSVGYFLSNKTVINDLLPVDLTAAGEVKKTQRIPAEMFRGGVLHGEVLAPAEGGIYTPGNGAGITAMGYIDGRLHIQVRYENMWETDNHGWLSLEDADGGILDCEEYQFWGGERTQHRIADYVIIGYPDYYQEFIWDISPQELSRYSLRGEFVLCDTLVDGGWEVTFNLD